MKRTNFFMKVITAAIFVAVVSYIGVYVYKAVINTYVTAPAISYSEEKSCSVQGYIVRDEIVLSDTGATALPIVGDGEKVASGQAVAVEYTSRESLETASELREVKLRIAQIEAPGNSAEASGFENVMALSIAVHSGDLSSLDELSLNIESCIFLAGASENELPALKERLESLENQGAGVQTVYAPASGVFSHIVDGFERIGSGNLTDLTPSGLTELFSSPSATAGEGKLVTGFRWYYVTVMDAADTARLSVGHNIAVQFSGAYHAQVDMRVESIGKKDDDGCVVVFSSDRGVHEIAALRFMRADVIFDVVSGIHVPKEAIHLDDDGTTFVYLQTGVRAERVNVEILLDTGDSYIVRNGVENGTPLREGATIIVKANGLFDGKVVG